MGNKKIKKKLPMKNMELYKKDVDILKKRPTKKKRERGKNVVIEKVVHISTESDNSIMTAKNEKEIKSPTKKKLKSVENNSIAFFDKSNQLNTESSDGFDKQGKSKEAKKKKKRERDSSKEDEKSKEEGGADKNEIYLITSGDEDYSKGMKKWITKNHQSRPGLEILQQWIDEFLIAHEEHLEQERKERDTRAAEGGWTVVTHHKGRKKTTDAESGISVGSVAQAVVEDKMAKKKQNGVGLNFYRFQRKEAQRNEIMMLQSKFEQDKKRIQQLRAARKFCPY